MPDFEQRCDKLRRLVRKAGADSILITNFVNVTYLTGFTGDSSYLLLMPKGEILLTDPRYTTQLEEECPGLELAVKMPGVKMIEVVEKVIKQAKPGKLAVEADSMTLALFQQIGEKVPETELVPTNGLAEELREIKDKDEVGEIRTAIECAERAFAVIKAALRPEQTEKEVADNLEHQVRLFGGKCTSFPPIIAVGPRAALPHARPSHRKIGESNFVLIDWGAKGQLYVSDLTRVLVTAKIPPKLQRIYEVVLTAQRQAIAAIKPGALMCDVDKVARDVIANAGHGKHFGHGLGHGIGQEIHEAPRLAMDQNRPLKAGMVVTVEPGIYLPGWGGVRIEDDVLVTKTGHEVLTSVPKEFADCVIA
jgi:Xaa-Pro aminopeptidase